MSTIDSQPLGNQVSNVWPRVLAGGVVSMTTAFLVNALLTFVWGWPGVPEFISHLEWFGYAPPAQPLSGAATTQGAVQVLLYLAPVLLLSVWAIRSPTRTLDADAELYAALASYIVRAAFWCVFLIGLVDGVISFLRVEALLPALVGDEMTTKLGLSKFRGQYVHIPLMAISCLLAAFTRSLSVIWLALLIVLAEFAIVITRFIFSYEQAFMGDLVRFWYASLFLLASAFSLVDEGHVRVDVFYARFSAKGKAWTNALGSLLLGIPLCWVILTMGLWTRGSSISSPLLSFEISQSGFGMYVKYLMAGCLLVFAASMVAQFAAYFLRSVAVIRRGDIEGHDDGRDVVTDIAG